MGGCVSNEIMTQVRAALPADGDGLTFQEIHSRVGMWSIVSIKSAVRQLREEGQAIKKGGNQLRPRFVLCVRVSTSE